jgi:hypothetical protein
MPLIPPRLPPELAAMLAAKTGDGPKHPDWTAFIETVQQQMDGDVLNGPWVQLLNALFKTLDITRVSQGYVAGDFEIVLQQAVCSQYPGEDDMIHLPERIHIRLSAEKQRIEFVSNHWDTPTGLIGSRYTLGKRWVGAVEWIEYVEHKSELVFFSRTPYWMQRTNTSKMDHGETVACYQKRVWEMECYLS